jgi:GntR family transcriptional regulator
MDIDKGISSLDGGAGTSPGGTGTSPGGGTGTSPGGTGTSPGGGTGTSPGGTGASPGGGTGASPGLTRTPAGHRTGVSPRGEGGSGGPAAEARRSSSPIEFRLDAASGVPTYLQLVQQVEHALRLGYLKPGDQLPKVRDVVASLAINPNTVLKAYKELETKGLAAGRPGQGTFVQATLSQVALSELARLRRTLLGWLASADEAGLDEDGIVALVTSVLRDFYERRRSGPGDGRGEARGESEGVA